MLENTFDVESQHSELIDYLDLNSCYTIKYFSDSILKNQDAWHYMTSQQYVCNCDRTVYLGYGSMLVFLQQLRHFFEQFLDF